MEQELPVEEYKRIIATFFNSTLKNGRYDCRRNIKLDKKNLTKLPIPFGEMAYSFSCKKK